MERIELQADYKRFLIRLKEQIRSSQAKAVLSVNTTLIQLYWSIGKMIAEKQSEYSWGNAIIEQLAKDLKEEFPGTSGFSRSNLFFIRQFYLFYSSEKSYSLLDFYRKRLLFPKKSINL